MKELVLALALGCSGGAKKPTADSTPQPTVPAPAKPQPAPTTDMIELEDASMIDDARKQMAAKCGDGNYTITQQGEEQVAKERVFRVHYHCNQK